MRTQASGITQRVPHICSGACGNHPSPRGLRCTAPVSAATVATPDHWLIWSDWLPVSVWPPEEMTRKTRPREGCCFHPLPGDLAQRPRSSKSGTASSGPPGMTPAARWPLTRGPGAPESPVCPLKPWKKENKVIPPKSRLTRGTQAAGVKVQLDPDPLAGAPLTPLTLYRRGARCWALPPASVCGVGRTAGADPTEATTRWAIGLRIS